MEPRRHARIKPGPNGGLMFRRSRNGIIIACTILFVFLLGMTGAWLGADDKCGVDCWVRETLGLFFKSHDQPAHPNFEFDLASYLAPFAVPLVALLATLQIALANLRRDLRGLRAARQSDHVVVCGIGEIGLQIIENLRDTGENVVAIDIDDNSSNALTAERLGATVLKGDATHLPVLQSAGLAGAKIVAICAGQDADNVDIALRIKATVDAESKPRATPLVVLVELRDEWLFSRLIDHDQEALGSASCEIRLFNTYQNTARVLLQTIPPPLATAEKVGAFVIIGFGSMGREVAQQILAAGLTPLGQPTRMLIVDREGEDLEKRFAATIAPVEDFATVSFIAADLDDEAAENWILIEQRLREDPPFAVAVCLPEDRASLHVAVTMRALLDKLGETSVPVYVRLGRHLRLGQFAAGMEQRPDSPDRLRPFGSMQEILDVNVVVGSRLDSLAQATHNYRRSHLPPGRLREPSYKPWPELAEQFKMSSRREADHMTIKLAQTGFAVVETPSPAIIKFTPSELELLARLEHRRWMIERFLQGWKYGPKRDSVLRLNEYLVDWDHLPPSERKSNMEMLAALPEILALAKREVRRVETGVPAKKRHAARPTALPVVS
jgi:hypothetical protein